MSIVYAFKEAFFGLRRAKAFTLVSMGIIAVSLLVLGVFVLVTANLYNFVQDVKGRMEIEVYLEEWVDESEAIKLKKAIEKLDGVESVFYVDKDQAALEFREAFGDSLLEAVSQNPLPTSIRIKVQEGFRTAGRIEEIVKSIDGRRGVEEIDYGRSWVEKLDRLILIILAIDLFLGLIIGLACVFVISNTVNLTVLARRESIEIMRLVGATEGFIRRPFLLEGMAQGLIGGLATGAVIYIGYRWLLFSFPNLPFRSADIPAASMVILGTMLGGLGSRTSLRRVLRDLP